MARGDNCQLELHPSRDRRERLGFKTWPSVELISFTRSHTHGSGSGVRSGTPGYPSPRGRPPDGLIGAPGASRGDHEWKTGKLFHARD